MAQSVLDGVMRSLGIALVVAMVGCGRTDDDGTRPSADADTDADADADSACGLARLAP